MDMRDSEPKDDGKGRAIPPAVCSICWEPVYNMGKATAKLHCNHEFHLDCIGSAFNAKGVMECPNCRKVEEGDWRYCNGLRSCPEISFEDWPQDEDLYDSNFPELPHGLQWCPFSRMHRLPSLFEEGEPPSTAYHELMGHHAIFGEHSAVPSSGHSCPYFTYFQLHPSSSSSNDSIADASSFRHHWNGVTGPSEISSSHAFATVDLHYHSWEHHLPSFTSGTDQASVPPSALRSIRGDSDGVARPASFLHPFLLGHGSGPRTGSSFISSMAQPVPSSISRTRERVQGLHAYHQRSSNSTGMRAPVFPSGRRSGAPRGMPPVAPVASSSDGGFVVFPPSGSSNRNHQEAENSVRNPLYAWERDRFAPFPLMQVDRESSWWGPFRQGNNASDSNHRSSNYWHRHGSERAAPQNRSESSSYQPVNSSARMHFI